MTLTEEDVQESRRQIKNFPSDIAKPYAGELSKKGRQTSLFMSRYYVIRDGALMQFGGKSDIQPKHIIFLKGLYFEKIQLGTMFGFNIYHDGESFRKRMLFHKDEKVVDEWIKRL